MRYRLIERLHSATCSVQLKREIVIVCISLLRCPDGAVDALHLEHTVNVVLGGRWRAILNPVGFIHISWTCVTELHTTVHQLDQMTSNVDTAPGGHDETSADLAAYVNMCAQYLSQCVSHHTSMCLCVARVLFTVSIRYT